MEIKITLCIEECTMQFLRTELGNIERKLDVILQKETKIMTQLDDLNAKLDAVDSALTDLTTDLSQAVTDATKAFADLKALIAAGSSPTDLTAASAKVDALLAKVTPAIQALKDFDVASVAADTPPAA